MKQVILIALLLVVPLTNTAGAPQKEPAKPAEIVELWFRLWNELDGTEATTNRLLELYAADALHQTGPSSRQIGPVFYEGVTSIRKMATEFGKAHTEIAFHIEYASANEKSWQLYHSADGPWGGTAVGVEYVGAYTVRDTNKRHMFPGAAFFHFQNGKIRRVRLYAATSELAEVSK